MLNGTLLIFYYKSFMDSFFSSVIQSFSTILMYWPTERSSSSANSFIFSKISELLIKISVEAMCNDDCEYKKMEEKTVAMGMIYDSINLDQSIREMIDNLLAERDGLNIEKVSLAYWAGVKDAIIILRQLEVISF